MRHLLGTGQVSMVIEIGRTIDSFYYHTTYSNFRLGLFIEYIALE
jgi:hypothetical protein